MDKPEAMRLADELDDIHTTHVARNAAAELRRLYAENEALRNVANRGGHIAVAMSRIDQLEAQRDALLELVVEMDQHEGAEGWSEDLRVKINAALMAMEETK